MRSTKTAWLVGAAVVTVLSVAGGASAQTQVGGWNLVGRVEGGVRGLPLGPSDTGRAKFEEYRDFTNGVFLEELRLRLFDPDGSYSLEADGSKWGQADQTFALRAGRLGLWQFGFEWDQTPHVFSTTARMLATETKRGVFTLPATRPALTAYTEAERLDEVSVRWDTARLALTLTPSPDLELKAEYTRIAKTGDRPMSVTFGTPGSNFMEVLEPIEQTVHDFRLKAAYAREDWQVQFGYTLSVFDNAFKSLIADNPCFGLAGPQSGRCGADATGAPERGLVGLAPDNMAHTVTLAGSVNLPLRTRVNASASYSLRLQNEGFLAHTINPAFAPAPQLRLPEVSLDGKVGTTLVNLQATSRPWRPLTLSLKYRLYDHDDMTSELIFPGHSVSDRTIVIEERLATRSNYTRHNLDVDGRLRVLQPVALTLGGGWERWDRDDKNREVPTSDEVFAKAALDVTPLDWLLGRLTYRPSVRRISEYNTHAHHEHTVVEELTADERAQGQSNLLRKFDQGERDRQRLDLLLQLMPTETFTTALTGSWRFDDYIRSTLGLQEAVEWSAGADFSWLPMERLSLSGGYVREWIFQKQRSRNRPVVGATTFDFGDFDWISDSSDTVDTVHAGATFALIPKVLDWNFGTNYSYALGRVQTRNAQAPLHGSTAQQLTATAKPWPAFEDGLLRVDTSLKYHFWKVWTAKLGYAFEMFNRTDWRTDQLDPRQPGVTSIWLGDSTRDYAAHILALTLGYQFK